MKIYYIESCLDGEFEQILLFDTGYGLLFEHGENGDVALTYESMEQFLIPWHGKFDETAVMIQIE